MRIGDRHYHTIWTSGDDDCVHVLDQRLLPHRFAIADLRSPEQAARAIADMVVRGAPLIGATAAWGYALGARRDPDPAHLEACRDLLTSTRPTAVNLRWALERVHTATLEVPGPERARRAADEARTICEEDVSRCSAIGEAGLLLLRDLHRERGGDGPLNVLTHCNAGWLGCVDWGTALAPIYKAHDAGLPVHVWVDETRPRNQGAFLTAWELRQHGVPHTVVVDNAGGHLMQHGLVDVCIVGTDRTTRTGDVGNKIGTYLKALAARDNGVPFYAAVPSPSIDWNLTDGLRQIPIEQRDGSEVAEIRGRTPEGELVTVNLLPEGSPVRNDGFDVTPAGLITGLITERGIGTADAAGLASLFPEHARP